MRNSWRPADLPDQGRMESPDPTPITKPIGFQRPPSLQEQIQAALRAHIENARVAEAETMEEADDFDVDDDPELKSQYEVDEIPTVAETQQRWKKLKKEEENLLKTLPKPAEQAAGPPAGPQGSNPAKT